ncbi:energy-coupling factor transporter transmembrane protein EcfT [Ligilactobacillus equi]|uniref:energy-coupling factor transporter transmembrane component T n=1 Tax=Ligilactobacillus equi TaxID=137357 RepID=UPI002ED505AF
MKFKLNPTIMLLLLLSQGLCLAFIKSISYNLLVLLLSLGYLAYHKANFKTIGLVFLITFPLSLGSFLSFYYFGQGARVYLAWIYASRIYAYLSLGMMLTLTTKIDVLLISLEQHLHLPQAFVYGGLAAMNMLSRIKKQLGVIKYSAQIRGKSYHYYQSGLYLRVIITALTWSRDSAQAMRALGFVEKGPRTQEKADVLPKWQWAFLGGTSLLPLVVVIFHWL